jgi:hypothetical protein
MGREGISLGWNCSAAQEGLSLELRKNKSHGYYGRKLPKGDKTLQNKF